LLATAAKVEAINSADSNIVANNQHVAIAAFVAILPTLALYASHMALQVCVICAIIVIP
jgi:hypothetical protein